MAVQIGAKPDSGFDDPIGMLIDCHRRIERFLHILCVVADRAAGRTLTEEEKTAVQAALTYFRTGGLRHTADEEKSLFPRLRTNSAAGNVEELDRLENDHRQANELHAAVDRFCSEWIASGRLDDESRHLRHRILGWNRKQHMHVIRHQVAFQYATFLLLDQTLTPRPNAAEGFHTALCGGTSE